MPGATCSRTVLRAVDSIAIWRSNATLAAAAWAAPRFPIPLCVSPTIKYNAPITEPRPITGAVWKASPSKNLLLVLVFANFAGKNEHQKE